MVRSAEAPHEEAWSDTQRIIQSLSRGFLLWLTRRGRWDEAKAALQEGLRLMPDSPQLAEVYQRVVEQSRRAAGAEAPRALFERYIIEALGALRELFT